MRDKLYADIICELHAETSPTTGSITLTVLDTRTRKKLNETGFPPEAIPAVIDYLQKHSKVN